MADIEQFFISSPKDITGNRWQVMRPLTPEEYASLKDGVSQDGIVSSIVVDANGDVIDGHTRLEVWAELLAEDKPAPSTAPVIRRNDLAEPKAIKAVARKLNLQRRQLSTKDRRIIVKAQIVETPEKSDNAIAVTLGVHRDVVKKMREEAIKEGLVASSIKSVDTKGREQPRTKDHSKNGDVAVSATSPEPDPDQTTIEEQIASEASGENKPVITEQKSTGNKTVKEAVEEGAPAPQKPQFTPEQRAYYDLFPYLNTLLELDPEAVANASADVEGAALNKQLFEEVVPWFERFFSALDRQRKTKIHAIK